MKRARVIPVLLLKNRGLCKTVRFHHDKYIGDPINAVRIFNEKQCDEIIFLDILASKSKIEIDFRLLEEIASECFMPFAYGGGIRTIHDIEKILKLGVEKVVLNSILLNDPHFLELAVKHFGSSTIVASVDVKKNLLKQYQIYSHAKINHRYGNLIEYIKHIEQSGSGELMINCVDIDGLMCGYDLNFAEKVSKEVSIPVVFCGGCGSINDIKTLLNTTEVSAAAAGSLFIYHGIHKGVLINYPTPSEISALLK